MWLPIDTNVLVDASGQGMAAHAEAAHTLLRRLLEVPSFRLAIDPKRKLQREYENRVNSVMFAHYWLTKLNQANRVAVVQPLTIPRGAKVSLLEAHLHKEDFHLIEAALPSGKIIVTRDFNSFQCDVITILRRTLEITVFSPKEMLDYLDRLEAAASAPERSLRIDLEK